MNSRLTALCDSFIEAKSQIKTVFGIEYDEIYTLCANMLVSRGMMPDSGALKECREMLKKNSGLFSSFRWTMEAPVTTLLTASSDPAAQLDRMKAAHAILKKYFSDSQYLVYASAVLADIPAETAESIAQRARTIYELMKRRHPFLTSYEDHVFCVLLAMSRRGDDELTDETEYIYNALKKMSDSNTIQSVSHILTLADGAPDTKCTLLSDIFYGLKELGKKYGSGGELTVLAALTSVSPDVNTAVTDIADADDYLSQCKDYRGFFNCGAHTRLMHATLLTAASYAPVGRDISGTLPMIAAEDALLYIYDISSSTDAAVATMPLMM